MSEKDNKDKEKESKARLIRIITIIIGVAIAVGSGYLIYIGFMNNDFMTIFMGFILFSFAPSLINVGVRPPQPLIKPINTVTVIKCENCDYTEIRDFKKGDFIFKQVGKCQKCGGDLYIKTIYTVEPKKSSNK